MMNAKVSGVRSIELGVRDLQQSADFYTKVWALEQVGSEGDATQGRSSARGTPGGQSIAPRELVDRPRDLQRRKD